VNPSIAINYYLHVSMLVLRVCASTIVSAIPQVVSWMASEVVFQGVALDRAVEAQCCQALAD